jgi:hypothetical protein
MKGGFQSCYRIRFQSRKWHRFAKFPPGLTKSYSLILGGDYNQGLSADGTHCRIPLLSVVEWSEW